MAACAPDEFPTVRNSDGSIENEWGMRFIDAGLYNEFSEFPLSFAQTPADIENYRFPDPNAKGRFDRAEKSIKKYAGEYAVIGDLETSIFETAWYLVGLEKLLMDIIEGAPYLPVLLDKIMNINMEIGQKLIDLGVDILWAGDDFGSQQGMIMSPEIWRRVFKPRIKILFETFRQRNPDIKIAWHSCGSIAPIIPDFIELGLDILNPIQPRANGMDPDLLKKNYGRDLVFFGGIDVQYLLPYGKPHEVKEEVAKIARILGSGGGYIAAPAHNIQDDTPVENIYAMYEAIKTLT